MSAGVKIDHIAARSGVMWRDFPRIATAGQDAFGDLDIMIDNDGLDASLIWKDALGPGASG